MLRGLLEFRPVPESVPFAVSRDEIVEHYSGRVPNEVELLSLPVSGSPGPEFAAVMKSSILTNNNVESARVAPDSYRQSKVDITLDSVGARIMSDFSEQNIGRHLAIVLDGQVLTAPVIQDRLGRQISISGLQSIEEAEELVLCLSAGSLPAPVTILTENIHRPE
jgi:preprotein translocase subunit SecD